MNNNALKEVLLKSTKLLDFDFNLKSALNAIHKPVVAVLIASTLVGACVPQVNVANNTQAKSDITISQSLENFGTVTPAQQWKEASIKNQTNNKTGVFDSSVEMTRTHYNSTKNEAFSEIAAFSSFGDKNTSFNNSGIQITKSPVLSYSSETNNALAMVIDDNLSKEHLAMYGAINEDTMDLSQYDIDDTHISVAMIQYFDNLEAFNALGDNQEIPVIAIDIHEIDDDMLGSDLQRSLDNSFYPKSEHWQLLLQSMLLKTQNGTSINDEVLNRVSQVATSHMIDEMILQHDKYQNEWEATNSARGNPYPGFYEYLYPESVKEAEETGTPVRDIVLEKKQGQITVELFLKAYNEIQNQYEIKQEIDFTFNINGPTIMEQMDRVQDLSTKEAQQAYFAELSEDNITYTFQDGEHGMKTHNFNEYRIKDMSTLLHMVENDASTQDIENQQILLINNVLNDIYKSAEDPNYATDLRVASAISQFINNFAEQNGIDYKFKDLVSGDFASLLSVEQKANALLDTRFSIVEQFKQ